ncbi:MAG: hypothetical protein AAGJ18_13075 [Bacteroidota bacterium]
MKFWLIIGFACFFSGVTSAQALGEWELRKDKKGIKVYVRNHPDSPIKQLKMNFSVEASMSAIVLLLQDIAAIPDWVYKCPEAKSLKKINANE